jgi:hypothetical protein
MKKNNFSKIIAIVFFLVLMGVSCWATVESLHLLLPSWPVVLFWGATVIFFVTASFGVKRIVDSFNQQIRVDNRLWKLVSGILLLLSFWLCFSLPTNTHTFFYRTEIKPVLIEELQTTRGKLELLQNGNKAIELIEQEKRNFTDKVNNAFVRVKEEVMDKNNPNFGEKAKRALLDLQDILGDGVLFQHPRFVPTEQGRLNCVENLQKQKDQFLASKLHAIYDKRIDDINKNLKEKDIEKYISAIKEIQRNIEEHPESNQEPTQSTVDVLVNAFSIISDFSDYLVDKNNEQEKNQLRTDFKLPKTRRMLSVVDVWKDYLTTDKFDGRGFIFWIILSALVDIAGFIFYNIAFKKEEDY